MIRTVSGLQGDDLRVPLLCTSLLGDVKPWGEGRGEALGGLAEGQAVIGGPGIERVALGLALGMEAAEHAFAQVD